MREIVVHFDFDSILSDRSWFTLCGKRINRKGEITRLPQTILLKAEVIERTRELRKMYPELEDVPTYATVVSISGDLPNLTFGYNLDIEFKKPFSKKEREYIDSLNKERDYLSKAISLCRREGYKLYPVKLTDDENNLRICRRVIASKDSEDRHLEQAYGIIRRIYGEVFGELEKSLAANYAFRQWLHETIKRIEREGRIEFVGGLYKRLREAFDETYLFAAPYNFNSFLIYMEINRAPKERFYEPRYRQLRPIVDDLQRLYDGELGMYGLSLPQGTGKTTLGLFFLAWAMGREPHLSNFATSYSDTIAESLYDRVGNFISSPEYTYSDIFPDVFVYRNSRMNRTVDFNKMHENPTLTCRTIAGSVVGVARFDNIGYADDMVSGYEDSLNKNTMERLWGTFVSQFLGRRKENGRILLIGTRWSVYDPIGRVSDEFKDNPKAKFVAIPALDPETETSNFHYDYDVGFSTEYYLSLRQTMDKDLWEVLYQQQSINKEGLVFPETEMRYYSKLPMGKPDAVLATCDSKGSGVDYVALAILYLYGNDVYVEDVVFNDGLPTITMPLVANKLIQHNVSRCDIESNAGGEFFALNVENLIEAANGSTTIVTFFTSSNKRIRIVTESDYIKRNFFFKNTENRSGEYRLFMRNVNNYLANGKVEHDDAPDCLSMASTLVKGLRSGETKVLNRARLPF